MNEVVSDINIVLTQFVIIFLISKKAHVRSGGIRGGEGAPRGPKCLHFHAVFGKHWPNNRLAPPQGLAPLSGKSWIRHWLAINTRTFVHMNKTV